MKYIKRFVLMLQFLTTIPLRFNLSATAEDYGRGLVFAPAVGLVIGAVLVGFWSVFNMLFPVFAASVLTMLTYMVLTGGLHLDGLGDTFDGLFSNRSKERMLEIMRDSRVGTNAVLAIVSVVLLDISMLASYGEKSAAVVLLLMPVAGRIGSLVASGVSVYARSGEGLGKSFIDYCGKKEMLTGLIIYFTIFYLTSGLPGLIVSFLPPLSAYISAKLFSRKIGGATGDILGAVCEINQTVFLLAVYILLQITGNPL